MQNGQTNRLFNAHTQIQIHMNTNEGGT